MFKDKLRPLDNLIITFSGHGTFIEDVGYWLPADAILGEDHNYISSSDLIDRLNAIRCRHLFLIIDASFSGKIFVSTRSPGLRLDEKRPSRYGLTACHSKEVAFDGKAGENSPFAKFLIQKLRSNRKLLQSLDYRNKLNKEDDLFTRKDKDMIADRRNNIRSELIDAFYEIGQKLLK